MTLIHKTTDRYGDSFLVVQDQGAKSFKVIARDAYDSSVEVFLSYEDARALVRALTDSTPAYEVVDRLTAFLVVEERQAREVASFDKSLPEAEQRAQDLADELNA